MDLTALKNYIKTPQKSILTLHRKPDGDSIGSNLAFAYLLKQFGHTVTIYSKDAIPESFSFLPLLDEVKIKNPLDIAWSDFDLFWALDMSTPTMLGDKIDFPKDLTIINIDHHHTNLGWGSMNIVSKSSISTASVILNLFNELKIPLNPEIATYLMTGLSTDSGFFMYIKTPEGFKEAAQLMGAGAQYEDIVFNLQRQTNVEDLEFISKSLAQTRIMKGKKCVIIPVSHDIWENNGTTADKNYFLTHYVQNIQGTDFGAVLIETEPGRIRVELRSRVKGYDVSHLAQKLGGGGHKEAAGAMLTDMSLDEAIKKLSSFID